MRPVVIPTEEELFNFFNFVNKGYIGTEQERQWVGLLRRKRRMYFGQGTIMHLFEVSRVEAKAIIAKGIECKIIDKMGTQNIISYGKGKAILAMIEQPKNNGVIEDKQLSEGEEVV